MRPRSTPSKKSSRFIRTMRRREACWGSAWRLPRTWGGSIAIRTRCPAASTRCALSREAIAHSQEAIRLSPLDPMMALCLGSMAVAHFTAGRYAQALHYTSEAARVRPGFQGSYRLRCASLAHAGRIDEARAFLATVRSEQPHLSLDWIRANVPYQTPELMERFLDGMRKAGLNGD